MWMSLLVCEDHVMYMCNIRNTTTGLFNSSFLAMVLNTAKLGYPTNKQKTLPGKASVDTSQHSTKLSIQLVPLFQLLNRRRGFPQKGRHRGVLWKSQHTGLGPCKAIESLVECIYFWIRWICSFSCVHGFRA